MSPNSYAFPCMNMKNSRERDHALICKVFEGMWFNSMSGWYNFQPSKVCAKLYLVVSFLP